MASEKVTSATFDSLVAHSDKPVLVDFWATWCGPCRALGPIVEEVSDEMADKINVLKCNVDDEADLATKFHIVSIPTLILFKDGQPVHTMVGNMPKAALIKEISENI
ncbi:thioredoxin [Atopobium fossor]|uniref:thioredoxin n=1 Tax=Atopobium fossor TaxID=39487 RepID=UPI000420A665|nr:thioredoxin [Atopobium fossor]